jgi:NADH-quinone oxidoreductase subunit L
MRKMGGIWRKIPVTYALMWIGSLALAGIPWFAGYFSKDMILEAAWASGTGIGRYSYVVGVLAAFLTAFYSWRLIIMTFHGKPRADHEVMHHVHESPKVMLLPLVVLALGAIFAGAIAFDLFVGEGRAEFWREAILVLPEHDSIEGAHHVPEIISLLPLIAAVLGIATAYFCYMFRPGIPAAMAQRFRGLYLFLLNKWYFDELYDALIVRPVMALSVALWKKGDQAVIDGFGPDGIALVTRGLSVRAARLQTGYLYHYAFAILIGVVVMVSWYLLRIGG